MYGFAHSSTQRQEAGHQRGFFVWRQLADLRHLSRRRDQRVATRRSEFAAILKSQGIDGRIAALNRSTYSICGLDITRGSEDGLSLDGEAFAALLAPAAHPLVAETRIG